MIFIRGHFVTVAAHLHLDACSQFCFQRSAAWLVNRLTCIHQVGDRANSYMPLYTFVLFYFRFFRAAKLVCTQGTPGSIRTWVKPMQTSARILTSNTPLCCACLVAITVATATAFSQAPSMTPTVELTVTSDVVAQPIRNARATYFNNFASPDGVALQARDPRAPATIISHTPPPKTELPQELADTIVVGKITAVQAYLSQNGGAIYTDRKSVV